MAMSGTADGSNVTGGDYNISWTAVHDTPNNRSKITWRAYWSFSSSPLNRELKNANVVGNGSSRWDDSGTVLAYPNPGPIEVRDVTLETGSYYVNHDSAGNANVTLSGSCQAYLVDKFVTSTVSGYSVALNRIPKAPSKPAAASSLSSTASSVTFTRSTPSDSGGASITQYHYQMATNSSFTENLDSWTGTGTTHTRSSKTRATTYYIRYRAQNSVGYSPYSDTVSKSTLHTVPDKPPAPVLGAATGTTIAWTAGNPVYVGAGVTAREVQRSLSNTFTSPTTATTASGTSTGLTRATVYYYRQRVQNAIGWSDWSSTASKSTGVDLPTAPTGTSVSDIAATSVVVNPGSVADNGGGGLVNLRIQYNTSASESGATVDTAGYWGSRYLTGLTRNTTYHYRVAAANSGTGGGWGPYGSWLSFTTSNVVPGPPETLSAEDVTATTARIEWTAPSDLGGSTILSYVVRVARNPQFSTGLQLVSVESTELSQVFTGLQEGTLHYAQAWTTSTNGLGSSSAPITFTTTGGGGDPKPLWQRIAGVWKQGTWWIRVGGVWKQATVWQRLSSVWKSS